MGPVKVRVLTLEPALGVPRITNADNKEEGTGAIWNFTAQLAGKPLAPMELSEPRTLTFAISDLRPLRQGRDLVRRVMNLEARIFAKVQKTPETTDEKTK